jgi:nucleoside-diphosphate-sugar epimerase
VPAVVDQKALELFADAAEDGRLRRLLYTSGAWVHGETGSDAVDETSPLRPFDHVAWRAAHEEIVMDLAQHEVVPVVFRPSIVYGETRGILGGWFEEARERGTVSVYGSGEQVWGLVHRDDVADAYRLGLEHGQAGDRFALSDGSALTVREIAESIARVTGATVQTIASTQVVAELGSYGSALVASSRVSSAKARRELGWVPRHTNFASEVNALFLTWLGPREARVL